MDYKVFIIMGALSGAVGYFLLNKFAPNRYKLVLSIIAILMAAMYIKPGIIGDSFLDYLEPLVSVVLMVLAASAIRGSLLFLIAAYFLHGVWDIFHSSFTPVELYAANEFAPYCVAFDWVIANLLLYKYKQQERQAMADPELA